MCVCGVIYIQYHHIVSAEKKKERQTDRQTETETQRERMYVRARVCVSVPN